MSQSNQLKSIVFKNLTSDASGNLGETSQFQVDGTIERIQLSSGQFGPGSLFVDSVDSIYGNERFLQVSNISGTSAQSWYPRQITQDISGVQLSNTEGTPTPVIGNIQVTASGCGANKSGANLSIFYK